MRTSVLSTEYVRTFSSYRTNGNCEIQEGDLWSKVWDWPRVVATPNKLYECTKGLRFGTVGLTSEEIHKGLMDISSKSSKPLFVDFGQK